MGLWLGKRGGSAAEHDALAQLAKLRKPKFIFELRLAGKNNLKKLVSGGFKVGEKTDFLHDRVGEVLRLVNNEDDGLPGAIPI